MLEAIIFCSAFLYDCKLGYEKRFRELCEEEFEEICKASILNMQCKYLKKYAMQVFDRLNICKVTFPINLNCDNLKQGVSVEHFPFVTLWHLCWMQSVWQSVWQGQTWSLTRFGFVLL